MIEGFSAIFPDSTNCLELDKSIISLFFDYYKKDDLKILHSYFRMLHNDRLKAIFGNYEVIISKENTKLNHFFNDLISCGKDIRIEIEDENGKDNIKIIVLNRMMELKEIGNKYGEWKRFLGMDKEEYNKIQINHKAKNYYFKNGYYYLSKFYEQKKDKDDIIKNYWYYHFYVFKERKFKKEDIILIIPHELFYFIEGITYILEHDQKDDWNIIKDEIILGFKFFEGIREINEKNGLRLNEGIDLFNIRDGEKITNITKILNTLNDLKKFFINKKAEKYWDNIQKSIEDKIKIVKEEKIKIVKKNKMERYKRELENILKMFRESYKEYDYRIKERIKTIESLIANDIDKEYFDQKFDLNIKN